MKDILIYGSIYAFSAAEFIRSVDEIEAGEPLSVRINTDGGDPQSSFGMMAKFQEFEGEKHIRVDGKAYSTGFFMCCYADKVSALDVSQFLIHRAAYPTWMENNPEFFTDEMRGNLKNVNDALLLAFKRKVDVKKFESITGVKVKDIFSMDTRLDVFINASQAKAIGLVDKVNKITPKMSAEITDLFATNMAAAHVPNNSEEKIDSNIDLNHKNESTMITTEDFKKENPEAHKALMADATKSGVDNEKIRVSAWMEHVSTDAEAVKAGIDSGESITNDQLKAFYKQAAEVAAKVTTKEGLEAEAEEIADLNTTKPEAEATEETEIERFERSIDAKLGLKNEKK